MEAAVPSGQSRGGRAGGRAGLLRLENYSDPPRAPSVYLLGGRRVSFCGGGGGSGVLLAPRSGFRPAEKALQEAGTQQNE